MHTPIILPLQSRLRELFEYLPETGVFIRKTCVGGCKAGSVAGSVHKSSGYRVINVDSQKFLEHRIAWCWVTGEDPGELGIDHKDRDRTNTRWDNLKKVTLQENSKNRSLQLNNHSSVSGVLWCKDRKKWRAEIGKENYELLGYFEDFLDATTARILAEIKYGYSSSHGRGG